MLHGVSMSSFHFLMSYDEYQVQLESYVFHDNGWLTMGSPYTYAYEDGPGRYAFYGGNEGGGMFSQNATWLTITFTCIRAGSSAIESHDGFYNDGEANIPIGDFELTCNQHGSGRSYPVGGLILPVNELSVLAPYLALIGLVASLSTVYALKRRRKT